MTEFGRLLAEYDHGREMPLTIHVPSSAEMRMLKTAELRLLLARAFATANLAADGARGHSRTMAELHISNAQAILRQASLDAINERARALPVAKVPPGAYWDDHYDDPDEELKGPPRPLPPRV